MKIDFSACSDDDVAELMIAATGDVAEYMSENFCPNYNCMNRPKCPAFLAKIGNVEDEDICSTNLHGKRQSIFRQCWDEIERRARG